MSYSGWSNEGQHFFIKIWLLQFILERSSFFSSVWDKRRQEQIRQIKLDYYPLSSYRAGSTDILDPLSPLLPIFHRPR